MINKGEFIDPISTFAGQYLDRGAPIQARLEQLQEQGVTAKLMIVGKKGVQALSSRLTPEKYTYNYTEERDIWETVQMALVIKDLSTHINMNYHLRPGQILRLKMLFSTFSTLFNCWERHAVQEFWVMPDTIKAKDSTEIAETLENYFLSGEVDKIEIAYSRCLRFLFLVTVTFWFFKVVTVKHVSEIATSEMRAWTFQQPGILTAQQFSLSFFSSTLGRLSHENF